MARGKQIELAPALFMTYAYDDTDEAPVLDVSLSLEDACRWMEGRGDGFVYRVERLPDGDYGNEQFINTISHLRRHAEKSGALRRNIL